METHFFLLGQQGANAWKWQPRALLYNVSCPLPAGLGDVSPVLLIELDRSSREGWCINSE